MAKLRRKIKKEYTAAQISEEIRLRIKVAVYAYAYEEMNDPLVSDGEYDALCLKVNLDISTGNLVMDTWFREEFQPSTGSWVYIHPDRRGLHTYYKIWKGYPVTYADLKKTLIERLDK